MLSEYIDLILDGAAQTAPWRGDFADDYNNPTATCALGAARYAYSNRQGKKEVTGLDADFLALEEEACGVYERHYGMDIPDDNDDAGRDYVIARLKDLL